MSAATTLVANEPEAGPVMDANDQIPRECSHCGGKNLQIQTIRSAFWDNDRLVVIEDIPAIVCMNCHEQFYDDTTAVLLDLLRGDGFPPEKALREITVPVFSLRDKLKQKGTS